MLNVHARGVHQLAQMALVVDIKRQVSGRGSCALPHPFPEGSRAAIPRARCAAARLYTRCCARRQWLLFSLVALTDVAIDVRADYDHGLCRSLLI